MDEEKPTYPELHKALVEALDKVQPVKSWGNKGHEFKTLKEIEVQLVGLHGDEKAATEAGLAMLRTFYRRRREGAPYWTEAKMTPNGWRKRWDDLIAIETRADAEPVKAGTDEVSDFLGAIQIMYERTYNQEMASAIARMLGDPPRKYLEALREVVARDFTPTATRPLPDTAAINTARASLDAPDTYRDEDEIKQLPSTCPFCGHPVRRFSKVEAICLGEYDERIHRKTGCGAEWERWPDGWHQGFRSNGKWHDGLAPDANTDWRKELAEGRPALDLASMIEDGKKRHRAEVKHMIDKGEADDSLKAWYRELDKPRPKVPGVKHVSELADAAEENW